MGLYRQAWEFHTYWLVISLAKLLKIVTNFLESDKNCINFVKHIKTPNRNGRIRHIYQL